MEVERADKNGELAQDRCLILAEELVTPVECRTQGLVPRHSPTTLPHQRHPILDQLRETPDAVRAYATGSELDRERNPIELPANSRDHRCLLVLQTLAIPPGGGPLHEELNGRRRNGILCGGRHRFRRVGQRLEQVNTFAFNAKRLATGREDAHRRRTPNEAFRQSGRCVDHVLAIVQDEQHSALGQPGRQSRNRALRLRETTKGRCHGRHYERFVVERVEIHEADRASGLSDQFMRDSDGHGRLSQTSRSNNADQSFNGKLRAQLADRFVPAHHALQLRGEGSVSERLRGSHSRWARRLPPLNRRDETVTAARDIRDEARTFPPVPKCFAQISNVNTKVSFLHHDVGPYTLHELASAEYLTRTLNQSDQYVQRTASKWDRLVLPEEQPCRGVQTKWTETGFVGFLGRALGSHPVFTSAANMISCPLQRAVDRCKLSRFTTLHGSLCWRAQNTAR